MIAIVTKFFMILGFALVVLFGYAGVKQQIQAAAEQQATRLQDVR